MTQWTNSARKVMEDYLAQVRRSLAKTGADPSEVVEDLQRHVDEELAVLKLPIVTEEDLQRILARIGPAEARMPAGPVPTTAQNAEPKGEPAPKSRSKSLLIFGVILPLLTLAIELATHMCAGTFFDPIPTFWHVLLVGLVPLANLLAWREIKPRQGIGLVRLLNGLAIGISLFYSLLFLPLVPAALIAILWLGWGLLPLAPLFAFISAVTSSVRLHRLMPGQASWLCGGVGLSVLFLSLLILPIPLTRHWMAMAKSDDPQTSRSAIKWLRALGQKDTLLGDCYGGSRWSREAPYELGLLGTPVDTESARQVYYRVTGQVFNSVPPPQRNFARGGWDFLNEFTWDAEHGGEIVGGRIQGLSLAQSRLDGLMDADAGWAYVEWILEFKNSANVAREARAQIGLPAGGVVSRLTLWVNGEEREAAFAGCGQVREAYRQVAVVQRRDPVLVTSCGPDRVMMQCFPVPPNGGTMKVRLGITLPPVFLGEAETAVRWPCFLERNFAVPGTMEHSVWMQAPQQLTSANPKLTVEAQKANYALHGQITDSELSAPQSVVRAERQPIPARRWVLDPNSSDGAVIWQSVALRQNPRPEWLVIVIDASRSMKEIFPSVADALKTLPDEIEATILLAKDGVEEISTVGKKSDRALHESLANSIRKTRAEGGHDNLPALVKAWDIAAAHPSSRVIWIHGPQPVLLSQVDPLEQRFFWQGNSTERPIPFFYDFQTTTGPNRILEKVPFIAVPRLGTVGADLQRLFHEWNDKPSSPEFVRERVIDPVLPVSNQTGKTSKHLARLWAFDEVKRLIAGRKMQQATELAARYQLVTPVSGAVVLENARQYEMANLKPVDATTVPNVPEPAGVWFLVGCIGLAWIACRHKRARLERSRGA